MLVISCGSTAILDILSLLLFVQAWLLLYFESWFCLLSANHVIPNKFKLLNLLFWIDVRVVASVIGRRSFTHEKVKYQRSG